jgi:hypothetical protein
MITDELFTREFETFHFKEIHRNPPKSLLKPPAGLFGRLESILAGGHSIYHDLPSGEQDMYAELEKELAKREPNFYDYLIYYMDKKHFDKESDLYRKAEISRPVFSKIRSMRETNHRPSKPTVIKLCLALELNSKETQEMLHTVGYGMSNSSLIDKIIMFFIDHNEFDIFKIDDKIYDKTNQRYLIEKM